VAQATQAPNPVTNPFAALLGKPGSAGTLSSEQHAIVDRVNGYLSGVQTLTGNFIQVGPDGSRTQGEFFISKPGRVRFEYDDPSPIELIADGSSVVVRDRRLATQDVYPLSQTPLRFLLADRVDLTKDTQLVAVYADDVFATVIVEERNGIVGTSRLMIMFSAKDMQLKQWTVTDPQGYDTTVAVYNIDTSKRPDPGLFKIDYTRYPTSAN
jgi:outer membrane lipoprotein-sorting protein